MKNYEKAILRDAINVHCRRNKLSEEIKLQYENDLINAEEYWKNRETEFSNRFWNIINDNFTDGCVEALKQRYVDKMTYQKIGDINGYSKTRAEQKVKRILINILKIKIWRILLFEEVYIPSLHKTVSKDNIYATSLSNRTKTVLISYCEKLGLDTTINNIANNLNNIEELDRIGLKTSDEIFDWFSKNGYKESVDKWRKTLPLKLV